MLQYSSQYASSLFCFISFIHVLFIIFSCLCMVSGLPPKFIPFIPVCSQRGIFISIVVFSFLFVALYDLLFFVYMFILIIYFPHSSLTVLNKHQLSELPASSFSLHGRSDSQTLHKPAAVQSTSHPAASGLPDREQWSSSMLDMEI